MTKDKQIAQKETTELVTVPTLELSDAEQKAMYGEFDRSDVRLSKLQLVQTPKQADEVGGKQGEFFVSSLGRLLGAGPIEFIVIMRSKTRLLMQPIEEGHAILCHSQDFKTGVGTPGGTCSKCPKAMWRRVNSSKMEKPPCMELHNFMVVLRKDPMEEWTPMLLTAKRSQLLPLKNLETWLYAEAFLRRLPLWHKSYTISSERVDTPTSVFYKYKFGRGNDNVPLPPEEQARAAEIFKTNSAATLTSFDVVDDSPEDSPKEDNNIADY